MNCGSRGGSRETEELIKAMSACWRRTFLDLVSLRGVEELLLALQYG